MIPHAPQPAWAEAAMIERFEAKPDLNIDIEFVLMAVVVMLILLVVALPNPSRR